MIYVALGEVLGEATHYFQRSGFDDHPAYNMATLSLFAGVVLMAIVDHGVHKVLRAVSARQSINLGPTSEGVPKATNAYGPQDELDHAHFHDHGHGHNHDHGGASILAASTTPERSSALRSCCTHFPRAWPLTLPASTRSARACRWLSRSRCIMYLRASPSRFPCCTPQVRGQTPSDLARSQGWRSRSAQWLASLFANKGSDPVIFGALFGLTGGMMLFVCGAELLPAAYGEKAASVTLVVWAFFTGCAVMALSLTGTSLRW